MAEYYRAFREVAVRHERTGNGRDSLFILSETDNAENFRLMTFYDLDDDEVPTYRIMDTRTHNKYGHVFTFGCLNQGSTDEPRPYLGQKYKNHEKEFNTLEAKI